MREAPRLETRSAALDADRPPDKRSLGIAGPFITCGMAFFTLAMLLLSPVIGAALAWLILNYLGPASLWVGKVLFNDDLYDYWRETKDR